MSQTILVVDDKANLRLMLKDYLSAQGYRVVTAENGQDALFVSRYEKPDLVLLDVMMPKMDGWTFMPAFRRESNVPVIILTAKVEETDKVLGLELGADDYVTKPFSMRELLARVRAQLRRAASAPAASAQVRVGEILLDKETRQVRVGERAVVLTPTEFELLATLMTAPGRVYTRAELLDVIGAAAMAERTMDVHVRNLRAKIETDPAAPRYIETVFSVGYRLNPLAAEPEE
ncbi:MAG: Alkaline phosphatase synthesis transcriptional regulatory protein PhoP [Anaerolineae bacterium]|nr:Alkaline phosphatase synthesis transcriptional regulatory protein PhoP [Anaerolineae bacterium]